MIGIYFKMLSINILTFLMRRNDWAGNREVNCFENEEFLRCLWILKIDPVN